jgi:ribonuclease HI
MNMSGFALFTDASLNFKLSVGAGAFLIIPAELFAGQSGSISAEQLAGFLRVKRFAETGSTALEIKTALWALESFRKEFTAAGAGDLCLYTDSQCLAGLLRRRAALERNDFMSKRAGVALKNAALYRTFFKLYDEDGFEVIKVTGHTRSAERDTLQSVFSFLDRETRKKLRTWVIECLDDKCQDIVDKKICQNIVDKLH